MAATNVKQQLNNATSMEHSIFPHDGDTLHIEDIELRFDDTMPLIFTDYLFIAFPSSKSPKIGLYPA